MEEEGERVSGRHGCGFFGVTERMSFVLFLFLFGEDGVLFLGRRL